MPAEHRAILLLLSLAVGGQAVRYFLGRPGVAPGAVQILADSRPGAPLAHRDSAVQLARPLAAGERVDVDRALAPELARLPRVGPGLARTIVADRAANGPFGSLAGLDRVPGVGAGLLTTLEPHVRFSGAPAAAPPNAARRSGPQGAPPTRAPINLNTASADQLQQLPGIGPAKAKAVVAYRDEHGAFGSVADLARVPGIGPSIVRNVQDMAVVR
jgi:competence protein ComEA